jgi:hypothetical protein
VTDTTRPLTKPERKAVQTLDQLAKAIRTEHAAAKLSAKVTLEHAIRCGQLLIQAKKQCRHGNFEGWAADHCEMSKSTYTGYMRLARRQAELPDAETIGIRDAIKLLAEPRAQAPKAEQHVRPEAIAIARAMVAKASNVLEAPNVQPVAHLTDTGREAAVPETDWRGRPIPPPDTRPKWVQDWTGQFPPDPLVYAGEWLRDHGAEAVDWLINQLGVKEARGFMKALDEALRCYEEEEAEKVEAVAAPERGSEQHSPELQRAAARMKPARPAPKMKPMDDLREILAAALAEFKMEPARFAKHAGVGEDAIDRFLAGKILNYRNVPKVEAALADLAGFTG